MTSAAAELESVLHEAGLRLTGPRRVVWAVLRDADQHLTADEVAEEAKAEDPAINLSSVYRSLALFSDLGIARESKLGGGVAAHWEIAHPDDQFHLRCTSCGRIQHHTGSLVSDISAHLADHHRFESEHVDLVVAGRCADCASR